MKALPILCTGFCLVLGCANPNVTVRVGEHNQEAYDLILRAYPCMEKFYRQPQWLPKDFCDVDLFIVIENQGPESICIESDWNSWGYTSIKLEIMARDGIPEQMTRKSGTWYRNFPDRIEIQPGSLLCLPLSLDDGLWEPNQTLDSIKKEMLEEAIANYQGNPVNTELTVKCAVSGIRLLESDKLLPTISSPWTSLSFRRRRTVAPTQLLKPKPVD